MVYHNELQQHISMIILQLMVEELYVLAVLDNDTHRRNDLMKKFTEVAVNGAFHFQPGYSIENFFMKCTCMTLYVCTMWLCLCRFAAFYLSAFPNTTAYMVPQGVLQGISEFYAYFFSNFKMMWVFFVQVDSMTILLHQTGTTMWISLTIQK